MGAHKRDEDGDQVQDQVVGVANLIRDLPGDDNDDGISDGDGVDDG